MLTNKKMTESSAKPKYSHRHEHLIIAFSVTPIHAYITFKITIYVFISRFSNRSAFHDVVPRVNVPGFEFSRYILVAFHASVDMTSPFTEQGERRCRLKYRSLVCFVYCTNLETPRLLRFVAAFLLLSHFHRA